MYPRSRLATSFSPRLCLCMQKLKSRNMCPAGSYNVHLVRTVRVLVNGEMHVGCTQNAKKLPYVPVRVAPCWHTWYSGDGNVMFIWKLSWRLVWESKERTNVLQLDTHSSTFFFNIATERRCELGLALTRLSKVRRFVSFFFGLKMLNWQGRTVRIRSVVNGCTKCSICVIIME